MLSSKNLVLIGGTSGIGLSAALAFVKAGANVVAVGVDDISCQQAQVLLGENGFVQQADAREETTAKKAITSCLEQFGSFDGLYHVAGGSGRKWGDGPLHELTLEGWNKTLELNLTSLMLSNRAAVQAFLELETGGSILNLGSVLATHPSPHFFSTHAYAAAKSAIIGFSKSIAAYYAKSDIRVNVLMPGLVATPMSQRAQGNEEIMEFVPAKQQLDGGRIGKPEDLDGLACYFMSDFSKFTTGQVVAVDGGWNVSG